jgi:hypothetical protein
MTTLLAQNGVDSSAFGAVACRETICRFSLKSKTGKKTEVQSLIHVARSLDDQTWLDPEEQEDGSFGMQVYYPREGYRLSGGGGKIGEPKEVVEAANL